MGTHQQPIKTICCQEDILFFALLQSYRNGAGRAFQWGGVTAQQKPEGSLFLYWKPRPGYGGAFHQPCAQALETQQFDAR